MSELQNTPGDKKSELAEALRAAGQTSSGKPDQAEQLQKPAPIGNVAAMLGGSSASEQSTTRAKPVNDELPYESAFKFGFLGSGQGGVRLADSFWQFGYRRIAGINTALEDWQGITTPHRVDLGTGGAGKDMKFAAGALRGHEDAVYELLTRSWGAGVDCGLVCVGQGGGTGSGTAVPLINIVRQYLASTGGKPHRVGAIMSLPTAAEGWQTCRNAVQGFRAVVDAGVSPLIVLDNEKVKNRFRPKITQLHKRANLGVSALLALFNRLAAVHSPHITFDRAELGQLLDGGLMTVATADIKKFDSPADVSEAIRTELAGNFLADTDLSTGRIGACLFVGHPEVLDRLDMEFFESGFNQMNRLLGEGAVVHHGLYEGDDPGLQVYTAIGGLDLPRKRIRELAQIGGLAGGSGHSYVADWLGVQD